MPSSLKQAMPKPPAAKQVAVHAPTVLPQNAVQEPDDTPLVTKDSRKLTCAMPYSLKKTTTKPSTTKRIAIQSPAVSTQKVDLDQDNTPMEADDSMMPNDLTACFNGNPVTRR